MRAILSWIVVLGLAVAPALAGTGRAGDEKDKSADGTVAAAKVDTAKSDAAKSDAAAKAPSNLENELQQLRDLLEAQAKQLQLQNDQLKMQQQQMQSLEAELKSVNTTATNALASNSAAPAGAVLATPTATTSTPVVATAGNGEQTPGEPPTVIHFKGVTLTPGGFFAAETVDRSKSIVDDINTDFKAVPFPGTSGAHLSEFNATARQSRISLLAEGKLSNVTLRGYYETDFLSAGVTSNNNESNSFTLRMRQFYGQAALDSGWTFTGGQMWSLITETRKGMDNRTEASPTVIDPQYTAGFSWARQYGFRVTKNFGNKLWLGASVENPETLFGGKIQTQNTLIAAPGDLGGLLNNQANFSYNATPDFIIKGVLEPGWGHYEVFGIVSNFRARNFPCAAAGTTLVPCDGVEFSGSAAGASNNTVTGGGVGGNARFPFFQKKFEIALHGLYGSGVGRYGTSTLADVTAHPDGTLVGLKNGQALVSLEWHPTPKLDIYAYGGGEYAGRAAYVNAAGKGVGYGSPLLANFGCFFELSPGNQNTPTAPGNCQGDIRNDLEGTIGFWHRIWSGPQGRIQWGMQYSYFVRNSWAGVGSGTIGGGTGQTGLAVVTNGSPTGIDNMFFTSFRYYLP
jgi:hypothetical protein